MKYQKKLSNKEDPTTGLTEYDVTFIPNPQGGPFICDEMFIDIYNLEYFSETLLNQSRAEFQEAILNEISQDSFNKIEVAITSFVDSTQNDDDLLPLKESIFSSQPEIISKHTNNEHFQSESIGHLRPDLIEDFNSDEFVIDDTDKILFEDILKYKKIATQITQKYLELYARFCSEKHNGEDLISDYSDIIVYRGFNNRFYYKSSNEYPDAISIYTKPEDGDVFFERNLLTSYSICPNVAEKFMVAFKSRRRMLLKGYVNTLDSRILSSFIVSDAFLGGQYEILCTPGNHLLKIYQRINDGDYAYFTLSIGEDPKSLL